MELIEESLTPGRIADAVSEETLNILPEGSHQEHPGNPRRNSWSGHQQVINLTF